MTNYTNRIQNYGIQQIIQHTYVIEYWLHFYDIFLGNSEKHYIKELI